MLEVESRWSSGARAVCLVSPTGSGKTVMASAIVKRAATRTLWITHRVELVEQSAAALQATGLEVGIVAGRRSENLDAPVIVAGWQTLVARPETRPPAELLVIDECHHGAAEEWRQVIDSYPGARAVGMTATPQRRDGKPLGDVFQALVVAAQYSELIRAGHIVSCRLFRPAEHLGADLAQPPVDAYERLVPGRSCVAFARSIEESKLLASELNERGHASASINAKTPAAIRGELVDDFRSGELRCLTSVFALTEGFDHPGTEAVMIARGCSHVGTYLQMVGRGLRPASGKTEAVIIDLSGVSWIHGLPTEDRLYSLDGRPISSSGGLKCCPECGHTWEASEGTTCPQCGFVPPSKPAEAPRIYDMALLEVYAGADTPESAKTREWERLRRLCSERGWTVGFAIREYQKLFHERPPLLAVSDDEWRSEFTSLVELGQKRGYKPGFALVRFKELAGHWPRREWRA